MARTSLIGFYAYSYPEAKMKKRINEARKALEKNGVEVNFVGYVSDRDEEAIEKAREKLDKEACESTSIVLIISAWVESPPVIRVISNQLHKPILMWSLAAYRTEAGLIAPAGAAGATGLNLALKTFGVKHISLYDIVDNESKVNEALNFIKFSDSLKNLRNTRIGSIGYADMDLYPLMYDGTLIKKYTGVHVDNLDLIELKILMDEVSADQISTFEKDLKDKVTYVHEPMSQDMEILARAYIAINKIIDKKNYKAISLKCQFGMAKLMNFSPCMLESLIGDKVDTICECDVQGLITQLIVKELTGTKAIFQEFYEFYENSMLIGACGFAPLSLCSGDKPIAQGHDWGDSGGIMNVSELKTGRVTLLKLYTLNGQMHMHLVTGNARTPERWQEDGWEGKGPKLPSMEVELDSSLEEFQENVAGQHYIVAYGDISKLIKQYCRFTGIRYNQHDQIDFDYK